MRTPSPAGRREAPLVLLSLEAVQNAGEQAGAEAEILVHVDHTDGTPRFRVTDDRPGFDTRAGGVSNGFVNVRDRLGAVIPDMA